MLFSLSSEGEGRVRREEPEQRHLRVVI